MSVYRKKLIEVALPLDAINTASAREKSIRQGHPSTLHLWWARRPLAAARAVLFAQLVDDPSAWPERFPTEADQERERQRLFGIIERMVPWEAVNDEGVLNEARLEIARSWARTHPSTKAEAIIADDVPPAVVDAYLATELPAVHDPFAGGGTIPLEAQRLGLRAIATDLNPVAVLINRALIDLPARLAGHRPVNPESARRTDAAGPWPGARGLAADIRYYGRWIRDTARERIGRIYPSVELPPEHGGGRASPIAWLWARTVASPDPACAGAHVPLVASLWLSKKVGREFWVEPVVAGTAWSFRVRTGRPADTKAADVGTKAGSRGFKCILSGAAIPFEYIRAEGTAGRLRQRLLAVVVDGRGGRLYLSPTAESEAAALEIEPEFIPDAPLPADALGFRVQNYGLRTWADLYTKRQLTALDAFSRLVSEAALRAHADARQMMSEEAASDYARAVALLLACCHSAIADDLSTVVTWRSSHGTGATRSTFARHALPMTWDFAEANPFAEAGGDFTSAAAAIALVLEALPRRVVAGTVRQANAATHHEDGCVISTDPPYYDNIGYADLSDFFYVWLRRTLRTFFPSETETVLVPKDDELVATPFRHGGRANAQAFFVRGMTEAFRQFATNAAPGSLATIYYAFKQTEGGDAGTHSTGWETFLDAILRAGFEIRGTWPIRTERAGRSRDIGSNALASSIVLVCGPRQVTGETISRGELHRGLREELPAAVRALQHAHIAPVDVGQAAIGPGMAVFSRYAKVLEADGSTMSVRAALQMINEVLDEHLAESEGDYDADTRWAITWFDQRGYDDGPYGEAEKIATGRNVAVSGIAQAGIIKSAAGKVRLLRREELRPLDYDPATDERPTVWEYTQHLIRNLEKDGEEAAAGLLKKLGPHGETARALAYRLYSTCERRKWADEALAYNGLVIAWPEVERIAAGARVEKKQTALDLDEDD